MCAMPKERTARGDVKNVTTEVTDEPFTLIPEVAEALCPERKSRHVKYNSVVKMRQCMAAYL